MSPRGGDPHTVQEQYEALRREATETTRLGPRGHGLALFLTRGLPGWLAALTALTPARRPAPVTAEAPRVAGTLLPSARTELTTLLAGMVLACASEREGR